MMKGYDQQLGFLASLLEGKREINDQEIKIRCQCLGITQLTPPFQVITVAPDYTSVEYREKDSITGEVHEFFDKELINNRLFRFVMTISPRRNAAQRLDFKEPKRVMILNIR